MSGSLPVPLAGPAGGRDDLVVPVLRPAEGTGHQVPERAGHGAGQRRDVDQVRRAEPLRVGHRVTEDQPALGIGVGDVDLLAVQRGHDVARAGRVRAGHVLDGQGDGQQRRPGGEASDGLDGGDDRAGPGLVHLHLFHPVGRLDADAAGVEADALADDRQMAVERVALTFLAGAHDDHPRRVVRPAAHGHEHAHAELGRALLVDDVDPQAVALGDRARLLGERFGVHVVRGAVAECPRGVGALADDHPRSAATCSPAVATGRDEDELVELGRLESISGRYSALGS